MKKILKPILSLLLLVFFVFTLASCGYSYEGNIDLAVSTPVIEYDENTDQSLVTLEFTATNTFGRKITGFSYWLFVVHATGNVEKIECSSNKNIKAESTSTITVEKSFSGHVRAVRVEPIGATMNLPQWIWVLILVILIVDVVIMLYNYENVDFDDVYMLVNFLDYGVCWLLSSIWMFAVTPVPIWGVLLISAGQLLGCIFAIVGGEDDNYGLAVAGASMCVLGSLAEVCVFNQQLPNWIWLVMLVSVIFGWVMTVRAYGDDDEEYYWFSIPIIIYSAIALLVTLPWHILA